MIRVGFAIAATAAMCLPGEATPRSRYERSDFLPAVSTQYARPDGGRRYEYPPDTSKIVRPEDRTAYDKPGNDLGRPTPRPTPRPAAARSSDAPAPAGDAASGTDTRSRNPDPAPIDARNPRSSRPAPYPDEDPAKKPPGQVGR